MAKLLKFGGGFLNINLNLNWVVYNENNSPLKLTDLEFLKEYEGKTWKDLPRDIQRKINGFQITINLIDKGTPEEVKYNIFSRINQGGEPLKPQEIRTALFQGYKTDLLEFLVFFVKSIINYFLRLNRFLIFCHKLVLVV